MTADTEKQMRVCRVCGVEKPLDEFGLIQRWHLRVCKRCRYEQLYTERRDSILKRNREYYREHRDVFLKQMKEYHQKHWGEYYQKHSKALIERSRDYYARQSATNRETYGTACSPSYLEKVREQATEVRAKNKELYGYAYPPEEREERKRHYVELRTKALEYYGGRCECCGESRYDMLTFDHMVESGYKTGIRGVRLVYDAIREYEEHGHPNGKYRILCWNCNMSRGFYKYCPHDSHHNEAHNYLGKIIKLEMIEAYGGKCVLCGETYWEFLTIDHINGGGNKHRKAIGAGKSFYNTLKKQGWPKNGYRLLCSNCNCSLKRNRWSQKGVEA